MRKNKRYIFFILLLNVMIASAQTTTTTTPATANVKRTKFFEDERLITMDLSTDLKKLVTAKKSDQYQTATVTMHFPDSSVITEPIQLTARGDFRRQNCFVPSIKLDFSKKDSSKSKLSSLKKLKLVVGCGTKSPDEKLLLKEYLVYKMYNILTPMSFRVRMLRINYTDTRDKIRSYSQYGFLIEDVDEMAKRNKCKEVEKIPYAAERTDRQQMTLVTIFQYMIGNTDWSVAAYHNMKLMRLLKDSVSFPYAIPYDFDFCGMVDANYAIPNENLPITSVKERLYRGYPRSMPEIQFALDIFRAKKDTTINLINNFEWLDQRSRRDVIDYIDEFYKNIQDKYMVERLFITEARRD